MIKTKPYLKKLLVIFILLFAIYSCRGKIKKPAETKNDWNFMSKSFKDKEVNFLSCYDVFNFKKQSDSTIIMNGEIFKDWKSKSLKVNDTLKLTENFFVTDSLGNRTTQIVSFSKQKEIYFQLIIRKKEISSGNRNDRLKNNIRFDYSGKLFINKKEMQYFSDFLYTK